MSHNSKTNEEKNEQRKALAPNTMKKFLKLLSMTATILTGSKKEWSTLSSIREQT